MFGLLLYLAVLVNRCGRCYHRRLAGSRFPLSDLRPETPDNEASTIGH